MTSGLTGRTMAYRHTVLYAYSTDNPLQAGLLKLGETHLLSDCPADEIPEDEVRTAARARIDKQTRTADVNYELEFATLAVRRSGPAAGSPFRDLDVHRVLLRSGFKRVSLRKQKDSREWFRAGLADVVRAVEAVAAGEDYLLPGEDAAPIVLRPEQEDAAGQVVSALKGGKLSSPAKFLLNAKMRFGKTTVTYAAISRLAAADDFDRVLVCTHRPVLLSSWREDFLKSGLSSAGWRFAEARSVRELEELASQEKVVVFVSIQDLRGSFGEDGGLLKNDAVFSTEWDLVVTDEAHEGTLTALARRMYLSLTASRFLDLSGTPFNLLSASELDDPELADRFSYDGRYDWTYLDERRTISAHVAEHGDAGPYAGLPEVRFLGLDISDVIPELTDEVSGKISMNRFLATRETPEGPRFINEAAVRRFLWKLLGVDEFSKDPVSFPYHESHQDDFRDALWMLPSVASVSAMAELLSRRSSGFSGFRVVCATGAGEATWSGEKTALGGVRAAIDSSPELGTITLSCQMLTTGVTVPEWTSVFMMSDIESPALFMQAAFRGASSWSRPGGQEKQACYVIDFHPDRMLRMNNAVAVLNSGDRMTDGDTSSAREVLEEYLSEVSVMSYKGGSIREVDASAMLEHIYETYAGQVLESGFSSSRLWNEPVLREFDSSTAEILEALRRLQGGKPGDRNAVVQVTKLSDVDRARLKELSSRKDALTGAEKKEQKELASADRVAKNQERRNRKVINACLTGYISKVPLLVAAAGLDADVTLGNLNLLCDDESWAAAMPSYVGRVAPPGLPPLAERLASPPAGHLLYHEDLRPFFNEEVFNLACRKVQEVLREAAALPPVSRALMYLWFFSTLRNPDKETVLTPSRVIETQMSGTTGGLRFTDPDTGMVRMESVASGEQLFMPLAKAAAVLGSGEYRPAPYWTDPGHVPGLWSDPDTTILDISAKSGLYPLYAAISLAVGRTGAVDAFQALLVEEQERLLGDVVRRQIFVNGKAPYVVPLAQQILGGPQAVPVNAGCADVLAVSRAIRVAKLSREQADVVWRYVLSPGGFGMMDERAAEVLMAGKAELRKLADGLAVSAAGSEEKAFTAVLSNPPYQVETESEAIRMPPVYQHFFGAARTTSRLVSLVHPSRWMLNTSGDGLAEFREEMLNTRCLRSFHDFSDSGALFTGVNINGGVCFYLWDREKISGGTAVFYEGNLTARRSIGTGDGELLSRNPGESTVLEKISVSASLVSTVPVRDYYGTVVTGTKDILALPEPAPEDAVQIFYTDKGQRHSRRIDRHILKRQPEGYRVAMSKTASTSTGTIRRRLDRIFIMEPGQACTGTFLAGGAGVLRGRGMAVNMLRYLKTDFVTFLTDTTLASHNVSRKNFRLVPLVDFATGEIADKPGVFLDFSSPETLDDQLAAIYGLTDEDREIMTKGLRPWKDKVDVWADA